MTKNYRTLFATVAIALMPLTGIAQAESSKAPTVGATVLGVEVNVSAVKASGYRASRLIGATVHNDKKKPIGTVNDLIVSTNGQVNLAIIDVGGFLGLGAKHVAIPTKLFERGANNTIVLAKATQEDLKAMPAFHYAR
ncbi:MAG: PRC-barrel domain-containing protein [Hyphomicrobiaceae bacterium]